MSDANDRPVLVHVGSMASVMGQVRDTCEEWSQAHSGRFQASCPRRLTLLDTALVLVRQQEGEPAGALDERGHVRLAGLLAEDQQVALPVAEGLAVVDLRRPVLDPALARDRRATGPAAVAAPTSPARLRQVAVEALLAALRGVDVAVDGLVADGRPSVRFLLEPAS